MVVLIRPRRLIPWRHLFLLAVVDPLGNPLLMRAILSEDLPLNKVVLTEPLHLHPIKAMEVSQVTKDEDSLPRIQGLDHLHLHLASSLDSMEHMEARHLASNLEVTLVVLRLHQSKVLVDSLQVNNSQVMERRLRHQSKDMAHPRDNNLVTDRAPLLLAMIRGEPLIMEPHLLSNRADIPEMVHTVLVMELRLNLEEVRIRIHGEIQMLVPWSLLSNSRIPMPSMAHHRGSNPKLSNPMEDHPLQIRSLSLNNSRHLHQLLRPHRPPLLPSSYRVLPPRMMIYGVT